MPIPTSIIVPIKGLYTIQAMHITTKCIKEPHITANKTAANLITAAKSHPTSGIQANSFIIGENNKK